MSTFARNQEAFIDFLYAIHGSHPNVDWDKVTIHALVEGSTRKRVVPRGSKTPEFFERVQVKQFTAQVGDEIMIYKL